MPTVESKKYGTVQFIDVETWNKWKETGRYMHFKVIDNSDLHDTITSKPDIVDFTQEPEPDRKEIRAKLDELEVEYRKNAPTSQLLDILNEHESNQNTE